eukprot:sb/3475892/
MGSAVVTAAAAVRVTAARATAAMVPVVGDPVERASAATSPSVATVSVSLDVARTGVVPVEPARIVAMPSVAMPPVHVARTARAVIAVVVAWMTAVVVSAVTVPAARACVETVGVARWQSAAS